MASPGKPQKKIEPRDIMKKLDELTSVKNGEVRIQYASNTQGFLVDYIEDSTGEPDKTVITGCDVEEEFPNDENAQGKKALIELFWFLTSHYGLDGSKYSEARINITTEPGEDAPGLQMETKMEVYDVLMKYIAIKSGKTEEEILSDILEKMWSKDPEEIAKELE